ncbi:hypothetical protein WN51_10865 [Melipona quadrifasciata]|uniref:Uncharacterized protein n=1 Tax=Melipona quadrifasciata TaxID=166423 RepID=A0A0M9A767_9HYME|nr:hypothetical protein WN51_10865 [Melipona quadrifasciata]
MNLSVAPPPSPEASCGQEIRQEINYQTARRSQECPPFFRNVEPFAKQSRRGSNRSFFVSLCVTARSGEGGGRGERRQQRRGSIVTSVSLRGRPSGTVLQ